MITPTTHSRTLRALAELSAAHPYARKLLVCQRPAQGRELLRALADAGTPWIGWETTTPRQLAHDLVALPLARAGIRLADDFDVLALVDEAIDDVQARGAAGPFGAVAGALGYRDALRRAIVALRAAGLRPAELEARRSPGDAKLGAVAAILAAYEAALEARRQEDTAGLLRRAVATVRAGRAALPQARLYLLAGHPLRGLEGDFTRLLLEVGRAHVIAADPAADVPPPATQLWPGEPQPPEAVGEPVAPAPGGAPLAVGSMHDRLFAAATPADELREVLRRVLARGIPWDQVEIVATDPQTYGAALDGLLRRLGFTATFAAGLDTRRTRVGRAVAAYFRWVAEGFPADLLRELLEAGDLEPPPGAEGVTGAALARRLRQLRVGWGQERYLPTIARTLAALRAAPLDAEVDADAASSARARRLRELEALHELLEPILAALPNAPDRARTRRSYTSPAALASALLVFLEYVPAGDLVENNTRKIIRGRLERTRATLTRETAWESALAILQSRLETRTAPAAEDGLAPWTSTGGRLHLADLATGGLAARPYAFVVGLDAARVAAGTAADPVLSDADRALLNRASAPGIAPLPTTADRIQEARHELAALLARLRGEVTLSYSAWDLTEGRAISPAPELLQQLRRWTGDDALSYNDLRAAHGPLVCAVPRQHHCLDTADIWLDALWNGRVLRRGDDVVRQSFPHLARGYEAARQRQGPEVSAYHGVIPPRPKLDPASDAGTIFSATRLEALGSCPRRYLYQYLLGIQEPDDPEWDPEAWLTARERGSLLHAVYEATLAEAREQELALDDVAFENLALARLEDEVEQMTHRVPPPSPVVLRAEVEALEQDVRSFVELIRRQRPDWIGLEYRFGPGERDVAVTIGGRPVRLRGAIDRVDRVGPGLLRVVDYKTGGTRGYRPTRPFNGGRRIQHLLYTLAAEHLLGERVEAMEYHFPTRRGQNEVVRYDEAALQRGAVVLETLFAIARSGHFTTTEDPGDCRFCAFAPICRASTDDYGSTRCPEVAWVKEHAWPKKPKKNETTVPTPPEEYRRLIELRGIDG
jgi:ATP-dependent helicase/nuclease subunit B